MRHAMIMAGGSGTRLWPVSRERTPKQLLRLFHRAGADAPVSLLELAAARLDGLIPPERLRVCTGERYRGEIEHAMPSIRGDRLLGEPEGRDTANAVGFAAAVLSLEDPDAVFAVLTADHVIEPDDAFRAAMDTGFRLVEQDPSRLVTFSITPTFPATGYGYVRRGEPVPGFAAGAFHVREFREKPGIEEATRFVAGGEYGWNSGMFIFHARTMMDLLARYLPASRAGLERVRTAWPTPDRARVLREVYPTLPRISIDYAIMEPASRDPSVSICGVSMPVRWLDVGSWPSFAETLAPDQDGNRTSGKVLLHDARENLAVAGEGHTIALLGCEGLTVVHTRDATLVMPSARAQDLKKLHERLPPGLT